MTCRSKFLQADGIARIPRIQNALPWGFLGHGPIPTPHSSH